MENSWFSIYLMALLFGWLTAHIVKFVITLFASGGKQHSLSIFVKAGGMPSSHTAIVVAMLTVIGARQGVGSAIFGLAATLAVIVIYDALNVRRSTGEQADVLRKVAAHTKVDARFYTAYGHTWPEVVGGVAVGLAVAYVLLQIL